MPIQRSVVPLVVGGLIVSGCGLALGIGDFSDAPATGAGGAGSTVQSSNNASATSASTSTSAGGGGGGGGAGASSATGGGTTSSAGATSSVGGSTASAGGAGVGGSGVGGGGGGGASPASCLLIGQPFNLLTPADVGNGKIDPKSLRLVADVASQAVYASAVAQSGGGGGPPSSSLFVRVVRDQAGSPAGALGSFPDTPGDTPRIYAGTAGNGLLRYYSVVQGQITRIEFGTPNNSLAPMGMLNPFTMPLTCDPTQGIRNFIPLPDAQGFLTYAASTMDNAQNAITLCYGTETAGPTTLGTGTLSMTTGFNLLAEDMLLVGGTTVLRTGSDGPGETDFAFATSPPTGLASPHRLNLTSDPKQVTVAFTEAPTVDGTGLLILGATISSGTAIVPATLWSGVIPLSRIGDIDLVPPPEFKKGTTFSSVTDLNNIGALTAPALNATSLITAAANFSETGVIFYKFSRVGDVRVASFPVYPAAGQVLPAGSSVIDAHATFLGDMKVLVGWTELSAAGDISVRGITLLCSD